jgi:transposase-like protein
MCAISSRLGMTAETLRKWVRQAEVDAGEAAGVPSETAVSRPMPFNCTRFWRSSSIPTGATAVFRCRRGGRPSYWSQAARENRSSPAGTVDASSGGHYWAANGCSMYGRCSVSEAAVVAPRSSALSSGRSLTAQQRVPSWQAEESGLRSTGVAVARWWS